MKIIEVEKPYSWLQWPVTFKNYSELKLHVTAKFFGNAEIDPEVVKNLLGGGKNRYTFSAGLIEWKPVIFSDLFHVLELTQYPTAMMAVHQKFDLIKDQFAPWRPHITVPLPIWEDIKKHGTPAASEIERFGELELYLGGE